MTPRQVIEQVRAAGLRLENVGDRLRITGGEELDQAVFEGHLATLRQHKAGVLQELREEAFAALLELIRQGKARINRYYNGNCWPDTPGVVCDFRGEQLLVQDLFCYASPLPHHRAGKIMRLQAEVYGEHTAQSLDQAQPPARKSEATPETPRSQRRRRRQQQCVMK